MAKKYIPSGYQIIEIDVSELSSGEGFTPVTDDEITLFNILTDGKMEKPILLKLKGAASGLGDLLGFALLTENGVKLVNGDAYIEEIYVSDTSLVYQETEL